MTYFDGLRLSNFKTLMIKFFIRLLYKISLRMEYIYKIKPLNLRDIMAKKIAIIGAGAAGFMCAIEAGKKGHDVHLYDHAKKPGEKIRISGGGRSNFTNKNCTHHNFISQNPHFCKSALSRYPAQSFVSLVKEYEIAYHEKNPDKQTGQLFCDGKSQEIIDMLLSECHAHHVKIYLETGVDTLDKIDEEFHLKIKGENQVFDAVVIATGGPSIPKMGASDWGHKIAKQFGHEIIDLQPALVPLTFTDETLDFTKSLSGVSIDSVLIRNKTNQKTTQFTDDLLFTHRGLSGPTVLQISSYWDAGDELHVNLLPTKDLEAEFLSAKKSNPKTKITKFMSQYLPARFIHEIFDRHMSDADKEKNLSDFSKLSFEMLNQYIQHWTFKPNGSEGYRTAEVTRGGVNVNQIDAKSFESKLASGLYFIGEVVDVTGHLGGHNFQWAWASGFCCGQDL